MTFYFSMNHDEIMMKRNYDLFITHPSPNDWCDDIIYRFYFMFMSLWLGSLKFSVLRNMGGRKRRLLPGRRRLWSCSYLKPSIWYSSLWFLKRFEILKYISYNCWDSTTRSDKRSQFFSITVFHFIKIKNSFSADWLDTTSLRRLFSFVIFL